MNILTYSEFGPDTANPRHSPPGLLRWFLVAAILVALGFAPARAHAAATFRPDRILVKPRLGATLTTLNALLGTTVVRTFPAIGGLTVLQVPAGSSIATLLNTYRSSGLVEYAEADFIVRALVNDPNDFRYQDGSLWGLRNLGQSGGTPGADIHASLGWDVRTDASSVIVAVVDTGIRATHEDIAANLWTNPGEIAGNGIDDDHDGYVDDVHGINSITGTGDPNDDFGHGTHVSGTIGATGNNGVGVVGVAWRARMMELKFIDAQGNGAISDAIECIDYARAHGARVINASWGGSGFNSTALRDSIASARDAGIVFVAAAGNSAMDNDQTPLYPASFDLDNIIAVAATDRNDNLAFFSHWGATTVDLGAPGYNIFSAWSGSDTDYRYDDGTSMAAAHVSGAVALVRAQFPTDTYTQAIQRIFNGTDPLPSLAGKTVTGGRLDIERSLQGAPPPPPPPPTLPTVTVTATGPDATEAGPAGGVFTVTRTGDTSASLTVRYSMGGSAANGTDYQMLSGIVIVTSGANSATVTVAPADDAAVEGDETAVLTLSTDASYTVGSPSSAIVTIHDNDQPPPPPPPLPTVTVLATSPNASEGGPANGTFTISRTGDTSASLTVRYSTGGSATNGTDYQALSGIASFGSGSNSVTVTVAPADDTAVEGDETAVLTLSTDASYTVGSPSSATVTIHDNDQPPPPPPSATVSVSAGIGLAEELGLIQGQYVITRSGSTSQSLTVHYSMGGTATNGSDYIGLSGTAVIPAGQSQVAVNLVPINDSKVELIESAVMTITPGTGYTVGSPGQATVQIISDDVIGGLLSGLGL